MTTSLILPAVILLPFVGGLAAFFMGRREGWPLGTFSLGITAGAFVLAIRVAGLVTRTDALMYQVGSIPLSADRMTALLLLVFSGLFVVIMLFAQGLIDHEIRSKVVPHYYGVCLILLAALMGVTLSQDLFTMYLFLEVVAVCAGALVAAKGDKPALEAALRYLLMSMLGSAMLIMGLAGLYMSTGSFNLAVLAQTVPQAVSGHSLATMAGIALVFVGIAVKAALFPLHSWLPHAHGSAATPSSVVISALLVKVNIVFLFKFMIQVLQAGFIHQLPLRPILLALSVGAILGGSLMALKQTDIKRMLAYSTVAQVGYIFLGLGIMNETALLGTLYHVLNHAVVKGMLVLAAGSIMKLTGRRRIADFAGVGRRFPLPMVAFTVGALSMVGVPPLSGFASKWYLGIGALEEGQPVLLAVLLVSSVLNALYYLPVVVAAFFRSDENIEQHMELPLGAKVSMVALAAACLLLGLFSHAAVGYIQPAVHRLFLGGGA